MHTSNISSHSADNQFGSYNSDDSLPANPEPVQEDNGYETERGSVDGEDYDHFQNEELQEGVPDKALGEIYAYLKKEN